MYIVRPGGIVVMPSLENSQSETRLERRCIATDVDLVIRNLGRILVSMNLSLGHPCHIIECHRLHFLREDKHYSPGRQVSSRIQSRPASFSNNSPAASPRLANRDCIILAHSNYSRRPCGGLPDGSEPLTPTHRMPRRKAAFVQTTLYRKRLSAAAS
jgi:hypothetical protein